MERMTGPALEGPAPRTLVVDRFPLSRRALVNLLGADGVDVVASAANAESAWALCQELRPDLVVADFSMAAPGDGIRLGARLKELPAPPLVLIYSSSNDPTVVMKCLDGAADCFVHRSAEPELLLEAVGSLVAGRPMWFVGSQGGTDRRPEAADERARLTAREQDVFDLLLRRYSNDEIAAALHLAHQTVRNYVSTILQKLEVSSRRELLVQISERSASCAA